MRYQAWLLITFHKIRTDVAAILDFMEKYKNLLHAPIFVQCLPNLAKMIFRPSFTKAIIWIFNFQKRLFGRDDQKRWRSRQTRRKSISQQPFARLSPNLGSIVPMRSRGGLQCYTRKITLNSQYSWTQTYISTKLGVLHECNRLLWLNCCTSAMEAMSCSGLLGPSIAACSYI